MTPKPDNLPPVGRMTPAQVIAEAARVLANSESPYSVALADALEKIEVAR